MQNFVQIQFVTIFINHRSSINVNRTNIFFDDETMMLMKLLPNLTCLTSLVILFNTQIESFQLIQPISGKYVSNRKISQITSKPFIHHGHKRNHGRLQVVNMSVKDGDTDEKKATKAKLNKEFFTIAVPAFIQLLAEPLAGNVFKFSFFFRENLYITDNHQFFHPLCSSKIFILKKNRFSRYSLSRSSFSRSVGRCWSCHFCTICSIKTLQ